MKTNSSSSSIVLITKNTSGEAQGWNYDCFSNKWTACPITCSLPDADVLLIMGAAFGCVGLIGSGAVTGIIAGATKAGCTQVLGDAVLYSSISCCFLGMGASFCLEGDKKSKTSHEQTQTQLLAPGYSNINSATSNPNYGTQNTKNIALLEYPNMH